ncbi:hypothetical protein CPB84DRAFT_440933 [Gymnopilus junonius]|uniref:Uncharacterized protein n=1 Tax=Gymnopilus junonius TaxID=109634 RepID=A0A9P5NAP1_GYMJU|nr:hypothetical protein CPB84DRAFT_440933 [Gymnopilus junonius]
MKEAEAETLSLGRILLSEVHSNSMRAFLPFSACFQRYTLRHKEARCSSIDSSQHSSVVQAMVTQAILGIRAFNLSRRDRIVGWFLLSLYCVACVVREIYII